MDDETPRDEKDRLGLTATVLRRSMHLMQLEVAQRLGVCRKQVSEIETGRTATPERVLGLADRIGFRTLHAVKTLDLLEQLGDEQRKPCDPLALTPEQELALYTASRELAARFETIYREGIRRDNLQRARQVAASQWERIEPLEASRRRAEIRQDPAFHTWSFCEYLCSESLRQAVRDPRQAILAGCLAVFAARLCTDLPWAPRLVAFALAHLANAFRVAGRHDVAEKLFARAHRLWSTPGMAEADPGLLDPGRIHHLESALRKDQRRLPEALALLDRAFELGHDRGRILVHRALALSLMGSYEEAIAVLRRADALLVDREPRDEFVFKLNTGVNLCHLQRFDEAAALAEAAYGLAEASDNRLDILRSSWLQARVLAGRGQHVTAFGFYRILCRDFDKLDMAYDLALVSLELATLLLSLGRTRDCRSLAARLPSYFKAKGIHEEALAALEVFSESVRRETATEALARQIVAFLYLAQGNPDLRFEPVSS